jgi:hypothetical protein
MKAIEHPLWFVLLRDWKLREKRTGLTFPYLVGALRDSQESVNVSLEQAESELFALLCAMCDNTPGTHVVRVGRCNVLKEVVAEVYAVGESRAEDSPIESSTAPGVCHLYVEVAYLERMNELTVASVYDNLRKRFAAEISLGNFSFARKLGYGSYSADEIKFIEGTKVKIRAKKVREVQKPQDGGPEIQRAKKR